MNAGNKRKSGLGLALAALYLSCNVAVALDITLGWDAPEFNEDGSPIEQLAGYRVKVGTTSQQYDRTIEAGPDTQVDVMALDEGRTYYFATLSYNDFGLESVPSEELVWIAPDLTPPVFATAPSSLRVQAADEEHGFLPDLSEVVEVMDNVTAPPQIALVQVPAAGVSLPLGITTVTLTATDEAGNASQHEIDVDITNDTTGRRPTLEWNAAEGATWYYIWMSRDGKTFYRKWINQTESSFTLDQDLPGGDYQWWVVSWGPEVGMGPWSPAQAFAVNTQTPDSIHLHVPERDIAVDQLVCSWDVDPQAIWYQAWVNNAAGTYDTKWLKRETTYRSATGLPYGAYKWWVRAWNPDGFSAWSNSEWAGYGLAIPVAPDKTTVETRRPEFTWTSAAVAERYDVWVGVNGKQFAFFTTQDTAWVPTQDMPGGSCSWWVRMIDADGQAGPWTGAATFTVPVVTPGLPEQLRATLTDTDGVVLYAWHHDELADGYELYIARDGAAVFHEVLEPNVTDGTMQVPLQGHVAGSTYHWWVRGLNIDGGSAWVEGASITIP